MINWVHEVCKSWGRAQYWLLYGKQGFPTRTMLGKLMEEGLVGAAFNRFTMEYPEVLVGENLAVANAIKTLPETPRTIITVHYVIRLPAKLKYAKLNIKKDAYYDALSNAHYLIANALQAAEIRELRKQERQNRPKLSPTLQVA